MGVRYTNQAITTEQQIEILQERGLLIDDIEQAIDVLGTISYFRLAGYWKHFEIDHFTHQFREGSCFSDIVKLYSFDKQLRALLFTAIQTIEVSVRTKIIKHFSPGFGAFWFMDETFALNDARFATNLAVIRKEVSRSHDDFITEHFRRYSEPDLPPVWKTLEVISMGTLSKLYSNFSDATAKHAVAREFGLNHHKFLRSWLECLAVLRNCCAHHSRLSNRVFPVKPKMPERMPNKWITDFSFREQTLYPQLCYLVYWLNSIIPDNTFVVDFKQLLIKYPSVNTRLLGFPYNWEQEPLWRWEDFCTAKNPSGLLRVSDTKQNSADRLLLQMEDSVHCHREKQQGFVSLHSVVSHSVNEVGKHIYKWWHARWLYWTQADACRSRAIEWFIWLAHRCWSSLPTYRILCDAGSDGLLGRICHPVCSVSVTPSKARLTGYYYWWEFQFIATERSSRVSLRSTQLFLTVSMRLENISTNDDLLDGSTERRLTLAEVEPSNGLYS